MEVGRSRPLLLPRDPSIMSADFPRIPLSTYRLQFNRSFTFLDAAETHSLSAPTGHHRLLCLPLPQSQHRAVLMAMM